MPQKIFKGRRKFLIGLGVLTTSGLLFGYHSLSQHTAKAEPKKTAKPIKPIPTPDPRLGINLSGIAYWASEFPFADMMHQSGEWVSQPAHGDWGTGPELALDENGWVKRLEKGCYATKILCSGDDNPYPAGTYVMLYDGEGEIELLAPDGIVKKAGEGRLEINVNGKSIFAINLIATNPDNHMRNIRVIASGLESSYQSNPWNPEFLKRWSGIGCIRLMDMMATNDSTLSAWQDRPKLTDTTYAEKGIPVELLVDLANRLETDVWFCMPHLADDDYIKQFAAVVKSTLKPNLKAWVEYSNEIWNGGFDQYDYAAQQGQALKLSDNVWQGAFLYNAKRSVEIFKIWERVFGGSDRLVRVIASQAANAWLSDSLLNAPEVLNHVDVLAIAPYVAFNVPIEADDAAMSADKVANWNLDQVFDYVNNTALPDAKAWIEENKKIADAYGVKLVAYEAGQHLVGIQGAENNDKLTALFKQANADKRMGEVYAKNLKHWQDAGGDLMCTFTSVEGWSGYGSWGLLQHSADQAKDSPKFQAVMEWAKSRGQKVSY